MTRFCVVDGRPLRGKRAHARTCSARCRTALCRHERAAAGRAEALRAEAQAALESRDYTAKRAALFAWQYRWRVALPPALVERLERQATWNFVHHDAARHAMRMRPEGDPALVNEQTEAAMAVIESGRREPAAPLIIAIHPAGARRCFVHLIGQREAQRSCRRDPFAWRRVATVRPGAQLVQLREAA